MYVFHKSYPSASTQHNNTLCGKSIIHKMKYSQTTSDFAAIITYTSVRATDNKFTSQLSALMLVGCKKQLNEYNEFTFGRQPRVIWEN